MCEPTTMIAAAGMAISAASTLYSFSEQSKAANRQEQAIQDGLARDRAATARQYEQINESAMDEQAQRQTEYLIDSARIKAIAGESGLTGAAQARMEQEAANNADADMATLEKNRFRQGAQAHSQGLSKASQGSIQLAGVTRPSALGVGLQIAGSAASRYGAYKQQTEPKV